MEGSARFTEARVPLGALSGTKAESERAIAAPSRRAPLSSLSGAKSRDEE